MKVKLIEPLRVSDPVIDDLSKPIRDAGHQFISFNQPADSVEELAKRSKDADIVMIANTPYPEEAFQDAKNLKLINVAFSGVDHVDVKAAHERGIQVCNASDYSTEAVSELVIGLTLALYRKITYVDPEKGERFSSMTVSQGQEIKGKTVGIIGTGRTGLRTAKLFQGFGAEVQAYSRTEKDVAKEMGISYLSLNDLLETSDIVSIHVPLTDETRGMIGRRQLRKMKKSAILINTARGPVVNTKDLVNALNSREIAGAGLDVFDQEPPLPEDHPLLHARNVVMTPHIGYLTDQAMLARARIAFDNTMAFLEGHPKNLIE